MRVKVFAEDAVIVDEYIYLVSKKMPVLYRMDINTGEVSCAGILYNESISMKQASRKIVHWKNKLIIVPYNASNIYIYNLQTGEISDVGFSNWTEYGYMYVEAFAYDDKIIMIGAFAKNIIELDLTNRKITVRNSCFEEFETPKDMFCRSGYVVKDDNLYVALAVSNMVLKLNLKTWNHSVINVGNDNNRFSGIAYDGNQFWLASRRGKDIFIWDGSRKFELLELPFEVPERKCDFGGVYYYDNHIWLHGFEAGYSAVIDPVKRRVDDFNDCRYAFFRNVGDEYIIGQDWNGMVHVFKDGEKREYDVGIDENILMEIKLLFEPIRVFGRNRIIVENSIIGISELIEMIKKYG